MIPAQVRKLRELLTTYPDLAESACLAACQMRLLTIPLYTEAFPSSSYKKVWSFVSEAKPAAPGYRAVVSNSEGAIAHRRETRGGLMLWHKDVQDLTEAVLAERGWEVFERRGVEVYMHPSEAVCKSCKHLLSCSLQGVF